MLGLTMRHEVIQALQITGGATRSIFPQAEAWIIAETDHQKALEYVAWKKDMNRYHSVMDFLFCELFPDHRRKCFDYYDGKGPMLKEIISVKELVYYSDALLKALEIAYMIFQHQRRKEWTRMRTNWTRFRYQVLKALAA